jgi:primase/DNA polymerase family protein
MFERIPNELKQCPQWVCWKFEDRQQGKLTKVPYDPRSGYPASVDQPAQWCDFATAGAAASTGQYDGIGFVLTERDPYCFIDLDVTQDQATLDRQIALYQKFDSYAERSPGGGCHIICKGHVPNGRRRSSIEVYSSYRYMTMTGDVIADKPIAERPDLVRILWTEMGKDDRGAPIAIDLPQSVDDSVIIQRASNAANGDKFVALWQGDWQRFYPSQSEADFALIDMFAFYTQNREQIVRLFRQSELGKRPKALRADYVNRMVDYSFDRMVPPVNFDVLMGQLQAAFGPVAMAGSGADFRPTANGAELAQRPASSTGEPETVTNRALNGSGNVVNPVPVNAGSIYTLPPGLVGEIADFVYRASAHPVPEISLVAAIGLMAGICGRSYVTPTGAGLNLYTLLLAKTGTGKEAIAKGITILTNAVAAMSPNKPSAAVPSIKEFVGPSEIRSDAALLKELDRRPCFVSILGEFGKKLKAMSGAYAPPHLTGIQTALLDLFGKADKGAELGEMIYSDKANNTGRIARPAFSIIGESTPGTYYGALSENLIEQGLLPRFLVIEYDGPRVDSNFIQSEPSIGLITRLGQLAATCHDLMRTGKIIDVQMTPDAERAHKRYDKLCTDLINGSDKEEIRGLWNRAHIKALKLASLLAVGINPQFPVIDIDAWNWSEQIVSKDVTNIIAHFEQGRVGDLTASENEQHREMMKAIEQFMTQPYDKIKAYLQSVRFGREYHDNRHIPLSYFTSKLRQYQTFKNAKPSPVTAIHNQIKMLQREGILIQLNSNKQVMSLYPNTTTEIYAVVDASPWITKH